MKKELSIRDGKTNELLALIVYNNGEIKIIDGEDNYKQALALEIVNDFEKNIYLDGKIQKLYDRKNTPEFLNMLAKFEEYNYGCKTILRDIPSEQQTTRLITQINQAFLRK
jgi:hypothetical protein